LKKNKTGFPGRWHCFALFGGQVHPADAGVSVTLWAGAREKPFPFQKIMHPVSFKFSSIPPNHLFFLSKKSFTFSPLKITFFSHFNFPC
jgi:hypothetical protein